MTYITCVTFVTNVTYVASPSVGQVALGAIELSMLSDVPIQLQCISLWFDAGPLTYASRVEAGQAPARDVGGGACINVLVNTLVGGAGIDLALAPDRVRIVGIPTGWMM